MTSIAFILGVVPLVIATGAGSEMRRSLGVAVFSGMLGVTLFGIFLTPAFYYVIQWFGGKKEKVAGTSACRPPVARPLGAQSIDGIISRCKGNRVPLIADVGPYKLFFYSAEGSEPPHVHVRRDLATAKFWLGPVRLARSRGFSDHELRKIKRIIEEHLCKS